MTTYAFLMIVSLITALVWVGIGLALNPRMPS